MVTDGPGFKETIEARATKAVGIQSQIMSILKGITFGHYYFEIALVLREALFVNGIMTNMEVFPNMKQKDINVLIRCDTNLVKSILEVSTFTYESLFLETGLLPIQFVLAIRRLLYLWHILTRNPEELIYKVYKSQELKPSAGDYFILMQKEKMKYDIDLSDQEISELSKQQFKKYVKEKVGKYAFSHLLSLGKTHSKSRSIIETMKNNKLETQSYLLTPRLTKWQKLLFFNLQTRNYDVKSNFKKKYEVDMTCRSCKLEETYEDERHLTVCPELNGENMNMDERNIDAIYGYVDNQVNFIKYFENLHKKRKLVEELC